MESGGKRGSAARACLAWCAAIALLLAVVTVHWQLVAPALAARAELARADTVKILMSPAEAEEIVKRLGGPERAARGLGAYLFFTRWTGDESTDERKRAAGLLGSCGKAGAARLMGLLEREPESGISYFVYRGLWRAGPDAASAVPFLMRKLDGGKRDELMNAITVLRTIGPGAREAIPALAEFLMDDSVNFQHAAWTALGSIEPARREPVSALMAVLKNEKESLERRIQAVHWLGYCEPGEQIAPELIAVLKHEDVFFRRGAAKALRWAGQGFPAAADALVAALKDPDEDVCSAAIESLAYVAELTPGTAEALVAFIDEEKDMLPRLFAAAALNRIELRPKLAVSVCLEAFRKGEETDTACVLLRCLGPGGIFALKAALDDDDAGELRRCLGPEVVPALKAALGGAGAGEIHRAREALAEIEATQAGFNR